MELSELFGLPAHPLVVHAAVVLLPLVSRRRPAMSARALTTALVLVATLTGAGAIWTVTEVGHSGAKATWEDVGNARG